jgi:hypothetical protein
MSNYINAFELTGCLTAIQSMSFAFMQGFLPHLADQQYKEALQFGLINRLGRLDVSSFATFGYCAGIHRDKDICVSHGWVIDRSEQV